MHVPLVLKQTWRTVEPEINKLHYDGARAFLKLHAWSFTHEYTRHNIHFKIWFISLLCFSPVGHHRSINTNRCTPLFWSKGKEKSWKTQVTYAVFVCFLEILSSNQEPLPLGILSACMSKTYAISYETMLEIWYIRAVDQVQ